MITFIGVVTLVLGIVALRLGTRFTITSLLALSLLGAAGAILLPGGGNISPAHLFLAFVVSAVLSEPFALRTVYRSSRFPNEGFWLICFVLYAGFSAYFFPRLLQGVTQVNPVGATLYGDSVGLVPLGPTSGNFNQSVYLLADAVCFFSIIIFTRTAEAKYFIARALMFYAAANIGFAALDIVTFWTNTAYLLDFIRNAQYTFHLEESYGGLKRIAGSFTEASSFAGATVGAFGFTFRLWLYGIEPMITFPLAAISLILLGISTSSTAIVSLILVLLFIILVEFIKLTKQQASRESLYFLTFFPVVVFLCAVFVYLNEGVFYSLQGYLDSVIFDKAISDSGVERSAMNTAALANFADTWGVGGGVGSIRASSFPVAVLASSGIIGTVLYLSFLTKVLVRLKSGFNTESDAIGTAARTACVGILFAACVSGTVADLGLPFFVFAAVSCSDANA